MSWGIKITLLYLGFVALILTLVFTCFGHKTELEHNDYYTRELKFQEQINASNNAAQLATPIDYEVKGAFVLVKIPKELLGEKLKGRIVFLRPSDASLDRAIDLRPNKDGSQTVNGSGFAKGAYKMQIAFSSHGKSYYKENTITLK